MNNSLVKGESPGILINVSMWNPALPEMNCGAISDALSERAQNWAAGGENTRVNVPLHCGFKE